MCPEQTPPTFPPPPEELMACLRRMGKLPSRQYPAPSGTRRARPIRSLRPFIRFLDGNGRVGRLLITLLFVARGVLPAPLLYLSAYLEATREEYYAHLLAITQNGQWEEWLTYFLHGVALQAEDAIGRIQRIDELFQHWSEQLTGTQSRQSEKVLELFVENPFWTAREIAQRLAVAYTTAPTRPSTGWESAGIVALVGEARRNRVYCARAMLEVLEAPHSVEQVA